MSQENTNEFKKDDQKKKEEENKKENDKAAKEGGFADKIISKIFSDAGGQGGLEQMGLKLSLMILAIGLDAMQKGLNQTKGLVGYLLGKKSEELKNTKEVLGKTESNLKQAEEKLKSIGEVQKYMAKDCIGGVVRDYKQIARDILEHPERPENINLVRRMDDGKYCLNAEGEKKVYKIVKDKLQEKIKENPDVNDIVNKIADHVKGKSYQEIENLYGDPTQRSEVVDAVYKQWSQSGNFIKGLEEYSKSKSMENNPPDNGNRDQINLNQNEL